MFYKCNIFQKCWLKNKWGAKGYTIPSNNLTTNQFTDRRVTSTDWPVETIRGLLVAAAFLIIGRLQVSPEPILIKGTFIACKVSTESWKM